MAEPHTVLGPDSKAPLKWLIGLLLAFPCVAAGGYLVGVWSNGITGRLDKSDESQGRIESSVTATRTELTAEVRALRDAMGNDMREVRGKIDKVDDRLRALEQKDGTAAPKKE